MYDSVTAREPWLQCTVVALPVDCHVSLPLLLVPLQLNALLPLSLCPATTPKSQTNHAGCNLLSWLPLVDCCMSLSLCQRHCITAAVCCRQTTMLGAFCYCGHCWFIISHCWLLSLVTDNTVGTTAVHWHYCCFHCVLPWLIAARHTSASCPSLLQLPPVVCHYCQCHWSAASLTPLSLCPALTLQPCRQLHCYSCHQLIVACYCHCSHQWCWRMQELHYFVDFFIVSA